MAKGSGLGSAFFVGPYDLSGDIGALTAMSLTQAIQDVSSIEQSGTERLGLRLDGSLSYASFWDPAPAHVVDVLGQLDSAAKQCTFLAPGTGVGRFAASLIAVETSFATAHGQDGSLGVTGELMGSAGHPFEWGYALTAGKAALSNGNGSAVDRVDTSTDFGMAAYVHVFAITSGTANLKIQDSANGTTGWADVPGAAFSAISAIGTERVATSVTENVKQFLRLVMAGTSTGLVAAVVAVPYRQ